jgi:hypothetical protein
MKLLKSGHKVDPSDLRKIRGGACSCGCGIGFNGELVNESGDQGGMCFCDCHDGGGNPAQFKMGVSASKYLTLP